MLGRLATADGAAASADGATRWTERARALAVVLGVIALFIGLSIASDAFLTKQNLLNLADQSVSIGIVAAAGTLVIVAGGFDLSVAAVFAVAGLIAAKLSTTTDVVLGVLAGILAGAALGTLNGLLVTVGRINSFLATLASALAISGVAAVATGGYVVTAEDTGFTWLGRAEVLGLKVTVIVLILFATLCGLLLSRTALGRAIYAVGANAEVARLAGLRVSAVRVVTFALSGAAAGLAGVLAAAQLGQGEVNTGAGMELDAIAAIVIGGTSIFGGSGAVWRTMVGVALLALVRNGLNLLGVDPAFQYVASGVIIIAALGLHSVAQR